MSSVSIRTHVEGEREREIHAQIWGILPHSHPALHALASCTHPTTPSTQLQAVTVGTPPAMSLGRSHDSPEPKDHS